MSEADKKVMWNWGDRKSPVKSYQRNRKYLCHVKRWWDMRKTYSPSFRFKSPSIYVEQEITIIIKDYDQKCMREIPK